MSNTYLSFTICNELFALNVAKVLEVLQKQKITVIPNAPDYIKGIINFRGEIVPVFEARTKFNFLPRNQEDSFVIIVLDLSVNEDVFRVGAIVDKVKDVINIEEQDIKPVPPMSKDFNTEFLAGIYNQNDDFIMILNPDKIFSIEEYEAIEKTNKQQILS
jgi:purine-binding chemotaxis protein CheW